MSPAWSSIKRTSGTRSPQSEGAIALLAMVILMAATLAITAGLSLRGLTQLTTVDTVHRGEEAFAGADGCVAEALRRLRDNSAYAGGTVLIGNTSCTTTVTDTGGGQRTIQSAAIQGSITRHIRAVVQLGTVILSGRTVNTRTLTSWEETTE
ncbi:MAG: Uncharacterized protein G01um1014106_123 [Parcubacteria group bacterium Gr01-1014_106]|nr:MAG: Uncharacterized protein G01um1014106_123 [Parcubacteria group bacterium Gr01-1014_106]